MHAFETILTVMLGAVLLSLLARRLKAPFPPFLALGGAVAAFLPFAPELQLDPELALALFVAPVLLDAAFDSSPRDLRRNLAPIVFLSVLAVCVTIVAVALTARGLRPELSWAAAIALGAIVAPPDAAAATAVLRAVPVPHRIRTILEGESLFNDATALLAYRLAVTAAVSGLALGWPLVGAVLWALFGSVAAGVAAAWLVRLALRRIEDVPNAILLQFISTFGVWILAERLGLSAIITVVVHAMVIARLSARNPAAVRAPSYAVWETVVFALNAMAFALVGLQVGPIWRDLAPGQRADYVVFALAVLAVAVAARLVWVLAYDRSSELWRGRARRSADKPEPRRAGEALVVGWSGMRGVVSLAAAYALPQDFPARDLLLFATFTVVMGTLVIQGFTLGPLIRLLGQKDDGALADEIRRTREAVLGAALARLRDEPAAAAERMRTQYAEHLDAIRATGGGVVELEQDRLSRAALEAKRETLLALRLRGEIGEAAYYQLEEELDRHELSLTPVVR
jgi:CPA1 family monovalent cation:H+ antiporter